MKSGKRCNDWATKKRNWALSRQACLWGRSSINLLCQRRHMCWRLAAVRKSQMQDAMLMEISENIKMMQVHRNNSKRCSDDSGILASWRSMCEADQQSLDCFRAWLSSQLQGLSSGFLFPVSLLESTFKLKKLWLVCNVSTNHSGCYDNQLCDTLWFLRHDMRWLNADHGWVGFLDDSDAGQHFWKAPSLFLQKVNQNLIQRLWAWDKGR